MTIYDEILGAIESDFIGDLFDFDYACWLFFVCKFSRFFDGKKKFFFGNVLFNDPWH